MTEDTDVGLFLIKDSSSLEIGFLKTLNPKPPAAFRVKSLAVSEHTAALLNALKSSNEAPLRVVY